MEKTEISQYSLKYRPRRWEDVYGQDAIVKALKKRVLDKNYGSAIIFQGQFGTGKTTMAELYAACLQSDVVDENGNPNWDCPSCKSILNGNFDRDTVRLDGSQLSGKTDMIDATRDLNLKPMYDKRKILIIEEADQISNASAMSLLKVLEGVKPWVTVILLSMENKIPASIKSRCQVYNVKPLGVKDTMFALKHIMEEEGYWKDEKIPQSFKLEGLSMIATASKGSMRTACQFLEECIVNEAWTREEMETLFTVVDETASWKVLDAILEKSNDETVWKFIMDSDAMELYNYMTLLLSEAIVCKETKFAYNEKNFDRLIRMGSNPNAERLYYCLTLNPQMSKPYLKTSDLLGALACYYQGIDFRPNSVSNFVPSVEVSKVESTTNNIPTRAVRTRLKG